MMYVKTCANPECGSQRMRALEPTEAETTIVRLDDNRVRARIPLPMICLDCGSTASTYQPLKERP